MNQPSPPQFPPPARPRRPLGVNLLILAYLTLSVAGWLRFAGTINSWELLWRVYLKVSPWYLLADGFLWGVLGLVSCLALWLRQRWAPSFALIVAAVTLLSYWIDRLILMDRSSSRANLPFMVGIWLVFLALVFGTLLRNKTRAYFQKE